MESEKVKEIKKKLKERYCYLDQAYSDHLAYGGKGDEQTVEEIYLLRDTIEYINELESENARLNESDASKEESSIEYYNLYKDLKRKNKDLNELCELQRVSIAESFVRENQLKERIAELEKENAIKTETITDLLKKQDFYEKEKLKHFAERLKEISCEMYLKEQLHRCINEALKEFMI